MRLTRYGDRGLRLEGDDLAEVHRLAAAVRRACIEGVEDVVPSWRTVLVTLTGTTTAEVVAQQLRELDGVAGGEPGRGHVVPVTYDGADLARVASAAGCSEREVIDRHVAATYTVAFLGFTPGFGYLAGLDPVLATPRLTTPRERVEGGSVGIADDVTGVYPTASPGGWNIIGHTTLSLVDLAADPPTLLAPGDSVRFAVA
jgi:KipI family sensor histidine kinase inhibitor